jgi:TRAF3-interacting protein 1
MSDFWQTTADMYSSLFDKPKMSEKLLVKPPFKYIFDIILETTNQTGFAKDLYSSPELNPEFYSNKENKILFLEKIKVN